MIEASNPVPPTRLSGPGDARGLAVLLVAGLLAAGTALPLLGQRGPAFPQPSAAQPSARPGADGETPASGATAGRRAEPPSTPPTPHRHAPLDINAAGVEALQVLPGIGPVLAGRIVADREAHGAFRRPEDLLRVPGIGPRRWERIRPLVRLTGGP